MLIVVPSLVSAVGVGFLVAAILVNHQILQDIFFSVAVVLIWLDIFITMTWIRRSLRSVDRRLRRIEADRDSGS